MGVTRRADRGNTWWFKFKAGSKRHRGVCKVVDADDGTLRYAKTKGEAIEAEAAARKAAKVHAGMQASGLAQHGAYTLAMALGQHIRKVTPTASASHVASLKRITAETLRHFGEDRPVLDIRQPDIVAYTEFLTQQKRRVWIGGPRKRDTSSPRLWKEIDKPRSRSEVNHCLDTLRAALQLAHRTLDPTTGRSLLPFPPDVPAIEEPKRDPTPMSEAEYRARAATRAGTRTGSAFGMAVDRAMAAPSSTSASTTAASSPFISPASVGRHKAQNLLRQRVEAEVALLDRGVALAQDLGVGDAQPGLQVPLPGVPVAGAQLGAGRLAVTGLAAEW
jgi:hypothetical protein